MPARLRDLARICVHFAVEIEKPGSGSHWKSRSAGGAMYPIPAHNGDRTEISDKYIRGLCRAHGIDYDEMKRLLGP